MSLQNTELSLYEWWRGSREAECLSDMFTVGGFLLQLLKHILENHFPKTLNTIHKATPPRHNPTPHISCNIKHYINTSQTPNFGNECGTLHSHSQMFVQSQCCTERTPQRAIVQVSRDTCRRNTNVLLTPNRFIHSSPQQCNLCTARTHTHTQCTLHSGCDEPQNKCSPSNTVNRKD